MAGRHQGTKMVGLGGRQGLDPLKRGLPYRTLHTLKWISNLTPADEEVDEHVMSKKKRTLP